MPELLNRHEVPMQPVEERGQSITATVPVSLGAMALPTIVKRGLLDVGSAKRTVAEWYDQDMEWYLETLKSNGWELPHLRGYEEFDKAWVLDAYPDQSGFLTLTWADRDGAATPLMPDLTPDIFYNQHDETGNFYTPDSFPRSGGFPILRRSIMHGTVLLMEPERMLAYGQQVAGVAVINESLGNAEVVGTSFNSPYQDNLAKALLLRNYGVYYMNQLELEAASA